MKYYKVIILIINEVFYSIGLYVPHDCILVGQLIVLLHRMLFAAMI